MKMQIFAMLILCTAFCCADSGNANIIRWQENDREAAVEETGLLEVFDAPKPGKTAAVHTFADRMAQRGKRFRWVPSEDPARGAGGARIPDAALSADGSALILLETIGSLNGPFDTRIVILDVGTGRIVRVVRLAKMRCTRLLTIPESDEVLLAAPQENPARIVCCCLKTGKITARVSCNAFSDWMIMEGQLFVKDAAKAELRFFTLPDLQPVQTCQTLYPGGLLLPGPEGTVLNAARAANAPWVLETLELDKNPSRQDRKRYSLPFPADFQPFSALSCGTFSVWLADGGAAYLLTGRQFHAMADRVTGKWALRPADGTLFLGLQKEDRIGEFHPEKSTRMERATHTGSISPKTRGEVLRFFPVMTEKSGVIVLDHRANVYRLQPQRNARKWRKTILFKPGE